MAGLREFVGKRVAGPVLQLLRYGATPERLAWSIAVGLVMGVNPLLGSSTTATLVAAGAMRLNVVGSQCANHLMYPLQILLFPVFVRMGCELFGTAGLPMGMHALFSAVKAHPLDTTRRLWSWEWHALVVWAGCAAVVAPVLKVGLKPVLERMLEGLVVEK